MSLIPLVELTRGGTLECQHFGAVAVADTTGRLRAHAGDPHWLTFSRSTLKALQALPFMEAGGVQKLGFSREQTALLCASHNGEEPHVVQVQGMLEKAGLTYKALQCGCHVPLRFVYTDTPVPAGLKFDERHHNCSGKHAGFAAYCVLQGLPQDDHLAPGHPLQIAIRERVARAVGLEPQQLQVGTDGCSAPNYAMPLAHLARGYARLAGGAPDTDLDESLTALADAMVARPELGSGTGRHDQDFMRVGRGDWVSKTGADGVQVVGSRSRGEAFALKIMDGNMVAQVAAAVEVMDQLGWLDDSQREALADRRASNIINARGVRVGGRRPVFNLARASA